MVVERRKPSWISHILRNGILWWFRHKGWTATGTIPEPRKFVLVAAPHTSNWDFIYFIGLTQTLGVTPHFMAKTSLFRWPMRNFMLDMGGVPVNRTRGGNYVQAMIDEFARRDEFMLTIAPEGTRGGGTAWKTGFYHIALGAGVPIVLGTCDYAKRSGGLGPAIWPTGDYAADMAKVGALYADVTARHPERQIKSILGLD